MKNKGYATILDATVALMFVLVILTLILGIYQLKASRIGPSTFKNLHYISEDILDVLNKKGILDEIGVEWALANGSTNSTHWINARNITKFYLDRLIPENIGYRVTIDNIPLYDSDEDQNSNRIHESDSVSKTHSSRLLVGYGRGRPTVGQVARAFLTRIREKETSTYGYFGGFVGQGNLTKIIELPSSIDQVRRICMEYESGSSFELWIDGSNAGSISSGECVPNPENYISDGGNHTFKIIFSGNDLSEQYIGGGYIKITYNTSEMDTSPETGTEYYHFPGIEGLINLYSSFYVPGILNSMEVHLRFLNNYTTYLTIGDKRVLEINGRNETQTVHLDDKNLSMLDYTQLSMQTVPLRLGIQNISHTTNVTGNADVILITDLSGSMEQCVDSNNYCSYPNRRIDLAKELDKEFVDIILNGTGNRVGLVSFYGIGLRAYTSYEDLTTDRNYLKTKINQYSAKGGTCICCAINKAYEILEEQSNESRQKFIVVMSDGIPSHNCGSGCKGTKTSAKSSDISCYGWTCCCPADPDTGSGCDISGPCSWWGCSYCRCRCAMDNANYSSCRANQDLNARVDSIGFGPVANCEMGRLTMEAIASCGNGTYYGSDNPSVLKEIYRNISMRIVNVSYSAQTASIIGDIKKSILYPESYIKFQYTPLSNASVYGRITLTQETDKFNDPENCTGVFFVTKTATVTDAKVTSYSGTHWTDFLQVNNSDGARIAYKLDNFGNNYRILGDPFIVQIPAGYINSGEYNWVEIRTGDDPTQDTGCSEDNRAIYTIRIPGRVGYGNVFPEKRGCVWTIEFEDNTMLEMRIPENYNGSDKCSYREGNISYDTQDAIDDATYRLISQLDSNENEKIDIKFGPEMIRFDHSRAGGVRSLWGPITIKLILWM